MQKEVVVVLVVVDGLVLAIWPVPQRLLLFSFFRSFGRAVEGGRHALSIHRLHGTFSAPSHDEKLAT